MNRDYHQLNVNEVYKKVINLTAKSLQLYLERSKKKLQRFDISQELRSRWQTRLDCLSNSFEGSWLNLQEPKFKFKKFSKKIDLSLKAPPILWKFHIIRRLTSDLFQSYSSKKRKFWDFKSWVFDVLIDLDEIEECSSIQAFLVKKRREEFLIKIKHKFIEKINQKHKFTIFNKYSTLLGQGMNFYFNQNFNELQAKKKILKETTALSFFGFSDSLSSNSDKELESQFTENIEKKANKNFILAVTEKVNRRKTKWRVILKDGILHMHEQDLLFNTCKCEFFW